MPKKKDKSGGGGSNATTPQRKLSDDYSSTPTSPSNHVNPGDSYLLKARQPNDQSNIVIVQKILQSAFTSYGLSSIDSLTTQNEAARFGARAANFFRFIHKMKPSPKAAKLQMVRDILTFPKQFTAADLEKAIEDSPFVQRLVERADQDPPRLQRATLAAGCACSGPRSYLELELVLEPGALVMPGPRPACQGLSVSRVITVCDPAFASVGSPHHGTEAKSRGPR